MAEKRGRAKLLPVQLTQQLRRITDLPLGDTSDW